MCTMMDGNFVFTRRARKWSGNLRRLRAAHRHRGPLRLPVDGDAARWRSLGARTTDGEYRCQVPIFAVGVAEPWRPQIPGIDDIPHYADTRPAESYAGKRVFIVGKEKSGFELATGFLQWAKQIVLASPSPTKLSINTRSLVGVRCAIRAAIRRPRALPEEYSCSTRRSNGSREPVPNFPRAHSQGRRADRAHPRSR